MATVRISPSGLSRRFIASTCVLTLAFGISLRGAISGHEAAGALSGRPSVVLILTDDQRFDSLWAMPHVRSLLQAKGVTFSNAFVVNPLCCPSRTSILTGKYSHSTGVYSNVGPYGGFQAFDDTPTIATKLHAAGYHTALIGKYLNGYQDAALKGYVPPGWDRWVAFAHTTYYDYELSIDGRIRRYGDATPDYSTDVLANKAVRFIRDTRGPLFLYFAPHAPHEPAVPAPRYADAFSGLEPYRPPSFDEADVSDKPRWLSKRDPLTSDQIATIDRFRINQYRSLLAVDDAVAHVVRALRDTNRLSRTFIVFMSDNGLLWGEHRLADKKSAAYEESIRVPMVVRFDPLTAESRTDDHLVLNIDFAPTWAALASTRAPGADGRNLLPLLQSSDAPWRHDFLVEHIPGRDVVPAYCAVRTAGEEKFVRYGTGDEELYDLSSDPYELENLAGDPSRQAELQALEDRADRLCMPRPPGFTWELGS